MIELPPETKLSAELRSVGERLSTATAEDLPAIGKLIVKLGDLAHAQELELQLLRDMEAGRELRVGVKEAIDAQFALSDRDVHGNVIFSKFRRKS